MRKLNEQAAGVVAAVPTPDSTPPKEEPDSSRMSRPVTVDPGAIARAAVVSGQVEPTDTPVSGRKVLDLVPGQSPWAVVLEELVPGLMDPVWQTRHGAALGIMEVTRYIGSTLTPPATLAIARHLLSLLALDRFGDFVGDTVVAPVRETAAQALGVLFKYLDRSGFREVHDSLMIMVRQPWARRGGSKETGERFAWEVRHAGLLGLKYEVAVRGDLLGERGDVKPKIDEDELDVLKDVVEAAILA